MSTSEDKGDKQSSSKVGAGSPGSNSGSDVSEVVLWKSEESSSDNGGGDNDGEEEETVDALLNLKSPGFSPILALKCADPGAVPLHEGAKKFLNLQQYSKAVGSPSKTPRKDVPHLENIKVKMKAEVESKKVESNEPEPVASTSAAAVPSLSTPAPVQFPVPGRRFLPHQMPVYRPRKEHPNTLTLMETAEGPLLVLKRVMKEKTRIKIWTRNDKGFRGYLTGFVEAFDKHWNIVLRDVDEQFVRRRVIKFPIIGDNDNIILPENEKEVGSSRSSRSNNEEENAKKEKAISYVFTRLQNYLRQNEVTKEITTAFPGRTTATTTTTKSSYAIRKSKRNIPASSSPSAAAGKSKTIYVGDMDPLCLYRSGLAKLSLQDDDDDVIIHQGKTDSSSKSSRKSSTSSRDQTKSHHPSKSNIGGGGGGEPKPSSTSYSALDPPASSFPVPTIHHQESATRTSLKKKTLTVFKTPYVDNFGFMVVAQTKKYELVERHVGQVLLMGNDIVFIETNGGGC